MHAQEEKISWAGYCPPNLVGYSRPSKEDRNYSMPKTGPRKTDQEKFSEAVTVRFTPEQWERAMQKARKVGLDLGTWVRIVALDATDWTPPKSPTR